MHIVESKPVAPTILLVDDDDVARLLTSSALQTRGFSVVEAESGEEAIVLMGSFKPEVILLDALMPGIDGFETCRRIRAMPSAAHLPILMLTGLDDELSITAAYEAGATDFFVKCEQWALLAQRVRYLLRASRMREDLEKSRAKEARAHRIARLGHWEWDVQSRTILASEECFRLVGLPPCNVAVPEAGFWQFVEPKDYPRLQEVIHRTSRTNAVSQIECQLRDAKGNLKTVHFEAEAECDEGGMLLKMHGVMQDITERKHAEDQIRMLANYDSLTGLSNRRLFREQFAAALEKATKVGCCVAVLFVDLDRFKQINDSLGHAAGDQLLTEVAARLNRSIRERDGIGPGTDVVARLGGDEFTILLSGLAAPADAEIVARRILRTLHEPIPLCGQDCIISASIGIATFPRDGSDVETLLRHADTAMYAAKANGKNDLQFYEPTLNATSKERLSLEQALHKAVERNELVLHYQPQIDTRVGKVVGMEALMRWNHGGVLIPPCDFIPLAEETGLIISFGEWAIKTAVSQNRMWIDNGFDPLPIAVNIPGSHFERPNFVEIIHSALRAGNIDARYLELEITETTLMRNLSITLPRLEILTKQGLRLSVDDFGTGYSSLSYLRRLPIDTLKIDASFVRDLDKDSDSEAIVAAIIAMARSLNLRVIAEGVETYDQLCLLHAYGCHIMQGYYFARPLDSRALAQFRREYGDTKNTPQWKIPAKSRVVSLLGANVR